MSRKPKPRPGHATLADIAALYDVSHQAVWRWSQREHFPSPSGFVACIPVFSLDDVAYFFENHVDHSKRPGGPDA